MAARLGAQRLPGPLARVGSFEPRPWPDGSQSAEAYGRLILPIRAIRGRGLPACLSRLTNRPPSPTNARARWQNLLSQTALANRTGQEARPTYFFLRTKIEPFTVLKVMSVPPPLMVASTVRSNSTRNFPSEVLFFCVVARPLVTFISKSL
jgi:hypothetical protein